MTAEIPPAGRTRCAVLGSPVAHSLSPAMHRAAYDAAGLDGWTYDAVRVGEDELAAFVEGLDDTWRGLSLTMPLKRRAMGLVDHADEWAELSGVANTVLLTQRSRLGLNTDVPGAMAALLERVHDPVREVVVLGGGATATSTLLAAVELGCTSARLLVRDPARAAETLAQVQAHRRAPDVTVQRLDESVAGGVAADLLVSTVPVSAQTPELVAAVADVPAVFDVVYDPWPTPLTHAAGEAGRTVVTGLDLLAHQAVLQVQVMTGHAVSADLLRAAALRELHRRGRAVEKPASGVGTA
ncbi:shikimate dehydrogenase [Nocardioides marmoraquaticus]